MCVCLLVCDILEIVVFMVVLFIHDRKSLKFFIDISRQPSLSQCLAH